MRVSLSIFSLLTGLLAANTTLAASLSLHTYNYTGAAATELSYNDGISSNTISHSSPEFGAFDPGTQLEFSFTLDEALPQSSTFTLDLFGAGSESALLYQDGISSNISVYGMSLDTGQIDHLAFPYAANPFFFMYGDITTDVNGDIVAWDFQSQSGSIDYSRTKTSSIDGDSFSYSYEFASYQDYGQGFIFPVEAAEGASGYTDQIGSWSSNVQIVPNPLPPGMALSVGGLGMLLGMRRIQKRRKSNT